MGQACPTTLIQSEPDKTTSQRVADQMRRLATGDSRSYLEIAEAADIPLGRLIACLEGVKPFLVSELHALTEYVFDVSLVSIIKDAEDGSAPTEAARSGFSRPEAGPSVCPEWCTRHEISAYADGVAVWTHDGPSWATIFGSAETIDNEFTPRVYVDPEWGGAPTTQDLLQLSEDALIAAEWLIANGGGETVEVAP